MASTNLRGTSLGTVDEQLRRRLSATVAAGEKEGRKTLWQEGGRAGRPAGERAEETDVRSDGRRRELLYGMAVFFRGEESERNDLIRTENAHGCAFLRATGGNTRYLLQYQACVVNDETSSRCTTCVQVFTPNVRCINYILNVGTVLAPARLRLNTLKISLGHASHSRRGCRHSMMSIFARSVVVRTRAQRGHNKKTTDVMGLVVPKYRFRRAPFTPSVGFRHDINVSD